MKQRFFPILALSTLVFWGGSAHAAPVGMAAHVQGAVTVTQNDRKIPLRVLGRLEPGATINCGPNSSAVIVLFKNSARFQIGANKSVSVGADSITGAQKLAALAGPSASAVKLLGNARVGAVMARPANSFQRLMPSSAEYLDVSQPVFSWNEIPGADRYTFTLFDSADNVVWSLSTGETKVAYPKGMAPLLEKEPYLWKLSAFKTNGKPLIANRWGIVTLLSSENGRALDELTSKLKQQAATETDNTALLLLVETYRSFGVINSALELLTGRLSDEPGVADATDDMLDSLSPFARVLAGRPVEPIGPL